MEERTKSTVAEFGKKNPQKQFYFKTSLSYDFNLQIYIHFHMTFSKLYGSTSWLRKLIKQHYFEPVSKLDLTSLRSISKELADCSTMM